MSQGGTWFKWIAADKNAEAYDHGKYLILWKMANGKNSAIAMIL